MGAVLSRAKAITKQVLNFLRLTDEDGLLSLTNLAVIISIVKIASSKNASVADFGTLLCSLANYHGKKWVNLRADQAPTPSTPVPPEMR